MMFDFDNPNTQEDLYQLLAALIFIIAATIATSIINS